jgi:hypothetical protein
MASGAAPATSEVKTLTFVFLSTFAVTTRIRKHTLQNTSCRSISGTEYASISANSALEIDQQEAF